MSQRVVGSHEYDHTTLQFDTWLWSRLQWGNSCTVCHAEVWVREHLRGEGKGGKRRTSSRIPEEAVAAAYFREIPSVRYGGESHRDFASHLEPSK